MIERCVRVCASEPQAHRLVRAMKAIGRNGWVSNRAVFVWTAPSENIAPLRAWVRRRKV